jgi:hypothetical protein
MTQRLVIKTGEYTNKEGETKGEYVKLGVLMEGSNGPYILMEPTVDLGGCLTKQNILAHSSGKQVRGNLMVSIFADNPAQSAPKQSSKPDFDDDLPF